MSIFKWFRSWFRNPIVSRDIVPTEYAANAYPELVEQYSVAASLF